MTIEFASQSEAGPVREGNEDFVGFWCPPHIGQGDKGALFVVADGVGGEKAGEVASREAVETLLQSFQNSGEGARPERFLKGGVEAANLHVHDLAAQPQYRRMRTTVAALLLANGFAHFSHVGDTRIYLIRSGIARQLTRDHSEVAELVRLGIISEDEARHHPRRNIITRSLGAELMLQAEVNTEKLEANDRFVLLTDGIWEPVEDEMLARVASEKTPSEACAELIRLAALGGSSDNLSVQVVRVVSPGEAVAEEPRRGLLGRLFGR